jgi:hypothetical protein
MNKTVEERYIEARLCGLVYSIIKAKDFTHVILRQLSIKDNLKEGMTLWAWITPEGSGQSAHFPDGLVELLIHGKNASLFSPEKDAEEITQTVLETFEYFKQFQTVIK